MPGYEQHNRHLTNHGGSLIILRDYWITAFIVMSRQFIL